MRRVHGVLTFAAARSVRVTPGELAADARRLIACGRHHVAPHRCFDLHYPQRTVKGGNE